MWTQLKIGSTRLLNASGAIYVLGRKQIHLERGDDDQLLLTMTLFDQDGQRIARLRKNTWAIHGERFDVTTQPGAVTLVHRAPKTVVMRAEILRSDTVAVLAADFHAESGDRVVAKAHSLSVGRVALTGNVFDGSNSALRIDHASIGI